MSMREKRLQEGSAAFHAGLPITRCPFDGRTQDGRWWRMGWMAAEADEGRK